MNEKKAREVVEGDGDKWKFSDDQWGYARGYLEAIEKAKGLQDIITKTAKDHYWDSMEIHKDIIYKHLDFILIEALAKWEKEK